MPADQAVAADFWTDLWQTRDQQGASALELDAPESQQHYLKILLGARQPTIGIKISKPRLRILPQARALKMITTEAMPSPALGI